ncbi:MAG: ribbon-helix-helix domain-containing protein [Myxococcota bacterium]|nr:ribbon-helix-helix domain-containing protein [Myxococcota bacterium]
METIAVRLPDELIARLDAFIAQINEGRKGAKYTRSEALRDLLGPALAAEGF